MSIDKPTNNYEWLVILLSIINIAVTFYISYNQSQITLYQAKIDEKIGLLENEIGKSQLKVSLIDPLTKGKPEQQIISMLILDSIDKKFANTIYDAMILCNKNIANRIKTLIKHKNELINGNNLLTNKKWEESAKIYFEVSKLIDTDEIDVTKLEMAKKDYENKNFKEAATKFNDLLYITLENDKISKKGE